MGASRSEPIKVGVVTDLTGPLSLLGAANANVARMVIDDINAGGGLLDRRIELYLEDSATTDSVGEARARKLVEEDRVDVVLGGIYSSMRQAIKRAAVEQGSTLYIYPEQYEGEEYHPLLFCTGPVPAQQVESMIPWLMQHIGARRFYCPSADYIWPHTLNRKLLEVVTAHGGSIVGEEYLPLDHTEYGPAIERIVSSGADVVFNTTVPPGLASFLDALHRSGFVERGGHLVCTYFDENFVSLFPPEQVEGLYSCLDYYQGVGDPFSADLLARYDGLYPDGARFTAGSAATGMYRGLKLWEAAVKEAGSLTQHEVVKALDHARMAQGPGGPAEMVPGQHHVRMNMYIGQVKRGRMEIVKSLGTTEPKERVHAATR